MLSHGPVRSPVPCTCSGPCTSALSVFRPPLRRRAADVTSPSPPDASDCHRNAIPLSALDSFASNFKLILLVGGFQMIVFPAPSRDERARTP